MLGYPSLVKGGRLKICCVKLRGFKSHSKYIKEVYSNSNHCLLSTWSQVRTLPGSLTR